jgi:hypothetical protein
MRRALPTVAVLTALLVWAASAFAIKAGYNEPTRKIEAAFKIAQFHRAGDPEGCYPAPKQMVSILRRKTNFRVGVTRSFNSVHTPGILYVVKAAATCDRLRLAYLAKGGLWVLNSLSGEIHPRGKSLRPQEERGGRGPLRAISLSTKTIKLTKPDEAQRGVILCPGKKYPLGGGMTASPAPDADGEGAYPHSYERLGAQHGWHINPVLFDPSIGNGTTPRRVTLQTVCAKGLVPASTPRKTIFLKSGETGTATASCPKGQQLISGGFQRTNFRGHGGDYVTESRAISSNTWRATGRAFGAYGGELTAIAYCDKGKRPKLTEVSASTPLPAGSFATATTPGCPPGQRLTSGGFSANGSHLTFFAAGSFNSDGTWSASGFGFFGPAPSLTAYGYCLRV